MAHHLLDLTRLPPSQLEAILRYGERPDFAALDGWIFRGTNLVPPGSWLFPKFAKGFFTETRNGKTRTMGYNVPCARGPLDEPWKLLPDPARMKPFGFYEVRPVELGERIGYYPGTLLLDYGKGQNGLDPSRQLRDYLVQVEPGNKDLYLGRAFFSLGPVWADAGYFALERLQKAPDKPPR